MASADVQAPPAEAAPAMPDYISDPNAVLKDTIGSWRYGRAPDYSKTRKYWQETKSKNHTAGSLEEIVENIVKNWEVEASFKTDLSDWRTIDHEKYTFAMNGGPPQTGNHMLKVGTYNAIIAPNEYYSPATSDFSSSHKTFKRMMPTFAWEVLEVYSGPPQVSFRWRHWGVMKNDYVGFNDKGEKVTAKAHGGTIDIQGVTVARVDDKLRVQTLETWMDSMEMFRQIAPSGIINKSIVDQKDGSNPGDRMEDGADAKPAVANDEENKDGLVPGEKPDLNFAGGIPGKEDPRGERAASANPSAPDTTDSPSTANLLDKDSRSIYTSAVTGHEEPKDPALAYRTHPDFDASKVPEGHVENEDRGEELEKPAGEVHPVPKTAEESAKPGKGEAVVAEKDSQEARETYEEMSRVTPAQCPFMNKE